MHKTFKTAYEEFTISVDFASNMSAETITSYSVSASDNQRNDVSTTLLNQASVGVIDTTKLKALVRAGSISASPYIITFKIVTSTNNKWEEKVQMRII